MDARDVLELGSLFSKIDNCVTTVIREAYVDMDKVIHTSEPVRFLNLFEGEINKRLRVAKEAFSSDTENKTMLVPIYAAREDLKKLIDTELEAEDEWITVCNRICDSFDVGTFVIQAYLQIYDVMRKGTDGASQDESEETYEFLLITITPVKYTKECLYVNNEHQIKESPRFMQLRKVTNAIVYPGFSDRSADVDNVIYYAADPAAPNAQLMEHMGLKRMFTTTELRYGLQGAINGAANDLQQARECLKKFNTTLKEKKETDGQRIPVDREDIEEYMRAATIPGHVIDGVLKHRIVPASQVVYLDQYYDAGYASEFEAEQARDIRKEILEKAAHIVAKSGDHELAKRVQQEAERR